MIGRSVHRSTQSNPMISLCGFDRVMTITVEKQKKRVKMLGLGEGVRIDSPRQSAISLDLAWWGAVLNMIHAVECSQR